VVLVPIGPDRRTMHAMAPAGSVFGKIQNILHLLKVAASPFVDTTALHAAIHYI